MGAADDARQLVEEQFPAARAAWLGGSVAAGNASPTSDLDITVLLDGPPAPFRCSQYHGDWPVELFVQTEASLRGFCAAEMAQRRPTTLRLVGESVLLVSTGGIGESLREEFHARLAVSVRTVSRVLARLGLNQRRFTDPSGSGNRTPRRIAAVRPGHMVHVDVKKVGRIPDGGGWRVHGRHKRKNTRVGYTFMHSAVDGYSRLAYTEALQDERAVTAIGFMRRAQAFFRAHGITRIELIVTDNGACYRAREFAKTLEGACHQRIKPYTPKHNGKVERYNRILAGEFLYAREWTSETQRHQALGIWNIHYNYHRPHAAAGDRPPASQPAPHRCHQRHGLIQLPIAALLAPTIRLPHVEEPA